MRNSFFYSFSRIFWSIYFVLSIAVIGSLFGYVLTLSIFLLAFALAPWPTLSTKVRHLGEDVQCKSIRMLLFFQPWLQCETNLPEIAGFYDQFPNRKVLFVANHRSNLDTFLLISYIPGLRGLAKSTLFYNVFFAPFMWACGFVPVKKGSADSFIKGLRLLRDRLLMRDRPVLMFPENTRCEKGRPSMRKFGAGIFAMAIESEAMIVPLAITATDNLLGKGDLFLHPFQPVKIKMLEPLEAKNFSDSQALTELVWNQIHAGIS
jgi:1-acyl-sn-glycerol-3-phosphate acyltransferase